MYKKEYILYEKTTVRDYYGSKLGMMPFREYCHCVLNC